MGNWEKVEASKYNDAYSKGYFPQNVKRYFEGEICKYVYGAIRGQKKLLDIGCGPCFTKDIAKKYDIDVTGLDITSALSGYWKENDIQAVVAPSSAIPIKDNIFDVIMAWDVMEHIPEKGLDDTLNEIKRVGKKHALFHFVICLTEEVRKFKGMQFHLTVKPFEWWIDKIREAGFRLHNKLILDAKLTHLTGMSIVEK